MQIVLASAALALAGAAGYLYSAPYLAFRSLRAAIETGDREALSERVDFSELRQGIKDQLNGAFLKKMEGERDHENPFAAIGLVLANQFIETTVNTYVTPDGILSLALRKLSAGELQHDTNRNAIENAQLGYASTSRFVARIAGPNGGEPIQLILSRQALSWKLTNVVLPTEDLPVQQLSAAASTPSGSADEDDMHLKVRDKLSSVCEDKLHEIQDPSPARWSASESKSVISTRKWWIGYKQPFVVTENGKERTLTISCNSILLDKTWTLDTIVYKGPDGKILRAIDNFEDADAATKNRVVAMRNADQEVIGLQPR